MGCGEASPPMRINVRVSFFKISSFSRWLPASLATSERKIYISGACGPRSPREKNIYFGSLWPPQPPSAKYIFRGPVAPAALSSVGYLKVIAGLPHPGAQFIPALLDVFFRIRIPSAEEHYTGEPPQPRWKAKNASEDCFLYA